MVHRGQWVVFCAVLAGCAVTDTGNPPLEPRPELDVDGIQVVHLNAGLVQVSAPAGTVDPPHGVLRVTNLDGTAEPEDAPVAPDGSLSFSTFVGIGDELRLQVVDGASRSRPVDVRASDFVPVRRPLEDCLSLEPALELDFGVVDGPADRRVVVRNECAAPIEIGSVEPRRAPEGFVLEAALEGDAVIGPDTETTVGVTVTPGTPGVHEEILFVRIDAPGATRRPFTVLLEAL